MAYVCEICAESFPKLSQLLQHRRTENHWKKFECDRCGKCFSRKDILDQHHKKHEESSNIHCDECGQVFSRTFTLQRHKERVHQVGGGHKRSVDDLQESSENAVTKKLNIDDPRQFYTITKIKDQRIEKIKTTSSSYKVNLKGIEVSENVFNTLRRLFNVLFEDLTLGPKSEDLVRLTVQSPSLDYPIVIPFFKIPHLTADRFTAEIERILQSNENFVIDSGLIIEVTLVDMPRGGAQKTCKYVNTEKFLQNKKCIIQIQSEDDLCCTRAITTAKARLDNDTQWNSIRQGRGIQTELVRKLQEQSGVPIGKCGIGDIKKFQVVIPDYQINVLSQEHFNGIIYSGSEAKKRIYLYFHDNHYDVVTSMPAFLSRNYFCTKFNTGYDHKENHKCNNVCHSCRKVHQKTENVWIHCKDCNRFTQAQECFDLHKRVTKKRNSTCRTLCRCKDCGKTINRRMYNAKHVCGEAYCNTCKDFFPKNHRCYMLPEENNEEKPVSIEEEFVVEIENAKTFIFSDFECTQDDLIQCDKGYSPDVFGKCQNCLKSSCGSYEHKPNLCVAQKACTLCMDIPESCDECGQREYIFCGNNTLDSFCQWLFSEENYESTVLCHNFQGYDSYPILQYLYKNAILPKIIPNGAKIMCLSIENCKLKMIDSINFLPMALAKPPGMFDSSKASRHVWL